MPADPNRYLQAMTHMFEAATALALSFEKMSVAARSADMPEHAIPLIEDYARRVAELSDIADQYATEIAEPEPGQQNRKH